MAVLRLTESKLSAEIKTGRLASVYLLYGKEPFLITTYAGKLTDRATGGDPNDLDYVKFDTCPDADMLSDCVDTPPMLCERKVVAVKDMEVDKLTPTEFGRYLDIITGVTEPALLILYFPNELDEKKSNAKKLIAAVENIGTVCKLDMMKPPKIAELCVRKAAKAGVVISQEDALYLVDRVGGKMTEAGDETAKLISYAGSGGMIYRAQIDALVPKQLDAGVFDLAAAINSGRRQEAFSIVDELFAEQTEPVNILSALATTYLDLYCARLAMTDRIPAPSAAQMFGLSGGRMWVFTNKTFPAASRLELGYLRETVRVLSQSDILLKSSPVSGRTVIDRTVADLFVCRESALR